MQATPKDLKIREVINKYTTLFITNRSNIAGFIVDSMKIRVFTELDQINTGSYK